MNTADVILIGALGVGGYIVINKMVKQGKENAAEADNSPEGQIAAQLKVVFDPFFPSAEAYRAVAIQITPQNKKRVYDLYRDMTGRNLSDDIAKLPAGDTAAAAKIQNYNAKPGKLFSISPENKIVFEVAPGESIRFAPGQTTPVTAYNSPIGIVLNEVKSNTLYSDILKKLKSDPKTVGFTVSVPIKPSARLFKVVATKEIPLEGLKQADDFMKAVRPYVRTKKVFAAIQISLGMNTKTGKPVLVWIDARDMISYKPAQPVKGLGRCRAKKELNYEVVSKLL